MIITITQTPPSSYAIRVCDFWLFFSFQVLAIKVFFSPRHTVSELTLNLWWIRLRELYLRIGVPFLIITTSPQKQKNKNKTSFVFYVQQKEIFPTVTLLCLLCTCLLWYTLLPGNTHSQLVNPL